MNLVSSASLHAPRVVSEVGHSRLLWCLCRGWSCVGARNEFGASAVRLRISSGVVFTMGDLGIETARGRVVLLIESIADLRKELCHKECELVMAEASLKQLLLRKDLPDSVPPMEVPSLPAPSALVGGQVDDASRCKRRRAAGVVIDAPAGRPLPKAKIRKAPKRSDETIRTPLGGKCKWPGCKRRHHKKGSQTKRFQHVKTVLCLIVLVFDFKCSCVTKLSKINSGGHPSGSGLRSPRAV